MRSLSVGSTLARHSIAVSVVVAMLVVVVAGCGGGNADAEPTIGPAPTSVGSPGTGVIEPGQDKLGQNGVGEDELGDVDVMETIVVDDGATEEDAAPSESAIVITVAPEEGGANSGGVMPDVLCMDLQAAQDLIQENGVFFSRSEDASGEGRRQILDRNWTVVGQTPAAGEPIGEGDAVLSVLKDDEVDTCIG